MFIKIIILFILSFSANAFYNPEPDAIAYRLGTGDLAGYSKVYFICPTGNDTTNNGLSPSAPFKTYAKFVTLYGSLLGNEAVAFCRGGVFPISAAPDTLANFNATASSPITIRDYQLPTGSTEPPKLVHLLTTGSVFRFEDGGNADSDMGVILKNLDIQCPVSHDNMAVRIYNDLDYLTVDNNHIHSCGSGIQSLKFWTASTRVALESVGEITFVHNAGVGGDTITRTTGTWSASIKAGDSLQITSGTSSANLNKYFRIESGAGTATLTISDYPSWDVIDEVVTSPDTTIYKSDLQNSNLTITNNLIENAEMHGLFGTLYTSVVSGNEFTGNGFGNTILHHNIYISAASYSTIDGNRLDKNALYQGGSCAAVNLVVHGISNNLTISNNIVNQPVDKSGTACWGISVGNGYTEFEEFRNLTITGNTVINPGTVGIGCTSCVDALIDNNTIIYTKSSTTVRGIVVPDVAYGEAYGNPKTSNVTITNNKIYGKGAASLLSTGIGILTNGSATSTEGFINVESNTIDNFNTCISDTSTGGWTVDTTGNTKTNCTTGN